MGTWGARLGAVAVVGAILAGCGTTASCSGGGYTAAAHGCPDPQLAAELPAGGSVQLLVEAGDTLPAVLLPRYQHMFDLLLSCLPEGTDLAIAPVDDRSATEAPLFWQPWTWPDNGNPVAASVARSALERKADAAFSALTGLDRHGTETEIWAALWAAAKRLPPAGSPRVIVCLCTAWEQSALINTADYNLPLDAARAAELDTAAAQAGETPDLQGVAVLFAGASDGKGGWADQQATTALQGFWAAALAPTGARLSWLGSALPGEAFGCNLFA